jgi:hypothetical protein
MPRDGYVKLNHKGIADLLKSAAIRSLTTSKAEKVLAAAQADTHDDTGAYEASLHIREDTTDRAVSRVVADDPKGPILEAKYGILSRALDAAK